MTCNLLGFRRVQNLLVHFTHRQQPDQPLRPGVQRIVRHASGSVRLSNDAVGNLLLAQFCLDDRGLWLQVANAIRGIHVNGRPVRRMAMLRAGDAVYADGVEMLIQGECEAANQAPARSERKPPTDAAMRTPLSLLALCASLLSAPQAMALSEFGIEGMGVVSTKANEGQATISPDGQRIVWASDRPGGTGGWDLWQAVLRDGRWQDPTPLPLNTAGNEVDPFFSHDGAWLYLASNRDGGRGGFDLYAVMIRADGSFGPIISMPLTVNTADDERHPSVRPDGEVLLLARNGKHTHGGFDLYVATAQGRGCSGCPLLPPWCPPIIAQRLSLLRPHGT